MAAKLSKVPRLIAGVDLTALPLSPLEGFVLSRIDGQATIRVLADLTNLEAGAVLEMVSRLVTLGVAEWTGDGLSLLRATSRPATATPSREIHVPPFLRGPPSRPAEGRPRVRVRAPSGERASVRPPTRSGGIYSSRPPAASDHIDTARMSVFPEPLVARPLGGRPPSRPAPGHDPASASSGPPPSPELASPPQSDHPTRAAAAPSRTPSRPAAPDAEVRTDAAEPRADSAEERSTEDEIELDLDRQKRINDLYYALGLLDHYAVLGVERTAPRKEIRNAYFTLSKVFHPDTMFRKRLGPYKSRMAAIFQRLTEAYETLGKKKLRVEYDRTLDSQDQTSQVRAGPIDEAIEERTRLGQAAAQIEAAAAAGPESASSETPVVTASAPEPSRSEPSGSQPAPRPAPPDDAGTRAAPQRTAMSERGRRRQRERMAKKLRRAARSAKAPRDNAERREVDKGPKPTREQVLRGLASSLHATTAQTGGVTPDRRHVAAADRAEADGDLATAVDHLRAAVLSAPDDVALDARYHEQRARLAAELAASYEARALEDQRRGRWASAAISWGKVVQGRPDDARAARLAAAALVESGGDMHKAKELAQRGLDLEPKNVEGMRTLARVFIAAGLELNARRVLVEAAKLDPSDEMVENLLRGLGR